MIDKVLQNDMEKITHDLGADPLNFEEEIFCPVCHSFFKQDTPMVFTGWEGWVDYECPMCGFMMSFRWDWKDSESCCSIEGYDIPKEQYTLVEESKKYWHFRDERKAAQIKILIEKGYDIKKVLKLPPYKNG